MKKILSLILIGITSVFIIGNKYSIDSSASFIPDEKISIEILKDNTVITINHLTDYDFEYAVVEYAYYDDGVKYAELEQLEVRNNQFVIKKEWIAIKVHQLKVLKNRVYYTYATSNKNSIGSFDDVIRKNIVEIETVTSKVKTLNPNISSGQSFSVYEFYFNFDKEHDELISIDVHYIIEKIKFVFWKEYIEHNENININKDIEYYDVKLGKYNTIKSLEKNTDTNIKADYVTRVHASKGVDGKLQNFNIIRIEYVIDGEFFIDDVINDPITPEQEKIDWFFDFIDKLKSSLDKVVDFFNSNASTVIKVVVVIAVLLLWALLSPVFKLFYKLLKFIFKSIINVLASILGIFF